MAARNNWKSLPGVRNGMRLNWGAAPGMSVAKTKLMDFRENAFGCVNDFGLHAIVSTWHEQDIIEATVLNCFRQGCDSVTILDNNSQDDTVERAVSVGASVGEIYSTDAYDDDLRIRKQNEIARGIAESAKSGAVWILCLDADEFIHGSGGMTVRDTLQTVPAIVRTVGCFSYDMYPEGHSSYVRKTHPAQSMKKCIQRRTNTCGLFHWKHCAIRYNAPEYDMCQNRGNHDVATRRGLVVYESSSHALHMIHAPYRNYEDSVARLNLLCGTSFGKKRSHLDDDVTGNAGAIRRLQNIDNAYEGNFRDISLPHNCFYGREIVGAVPYPLSSYCPDIPESHFDLPDSLKSFIQ